MSKELDYSRNPKLTYIKWGVVYVVFFALAATIFLLIADRIHTYSIPQGSFELTIPYSKYLVGESVAFTLKNNFNSPVRVTNDCPGEPLAVYKLDGKNWVRIHAQASSDSCKQKERQITIPAGGQQSGNFDEWKELFANPGTYRVVARVQYFNSMPYQDFKVIKKPTPAPAPAPVPTPVRTTVPSTVQYDDDEEEDEHEDEEEEEEDDD